MVPNPKEIYLKRKLEEFTLEEVFEQFDLDPEETLIRMDRLGFIDLDYYMEDEFIDDGEDTEVD